MWLVFWVDDTMAVLLQILSKRVLRPRWWDFVSQQATLSLEICRIVATINKKLLSEGLMLQFRENP